MNSFTKWWIVVLVILLIPFNAYALGEYWNHEMERKNSPSFLNYISIGEKITMDENYSNPQKWNQRCDVYYNETSMCGDWYEVEIVPGSSWSITYSKGWFD